MKASPVWLIAVPNEKGSQESYNKMYEAVVPTNYADITPFNIPDLQFYLNRHQAHATCNLTSSYLIGEPAAAHPNIILQTLPIF